MQTAAMDHYGLVVAICKDLKIAERIESRLIQDPQRKVSSGIAAVAIIINGLGFTNRRLYLTHRFFETKPIERLLSPEFEAHLFYAFFIEDCAAYQATFSPVCV